jgi:hypothetical protein
VVHKDGAGATDVIIYARKAKGVHVFSGYGEDTVIAFVRSVGRSDALTRN